MDDAFNSNLDRYIAKLQHLRKEADGVRPLWPSPGKADHSALALKSARTFLAYCAVVGTLRRHVSSLAEIGGVTLFYVPEKWELDEVKNAFETVFKDDRQIRICLHPKSKGRRGWEIDATEFLAAKRLVIVASEGTLIHQDFELAITTRAHIDLGNARHLRALARLRGCGSISDDDLAIISRQPSERMEAIFRIGQPVERAMKRLLTEGGSLNRPKNLDISLGFGQASEWASDLRKDLEEWRRGQLPWSEVSKGCLFYGPPGTGKTQFAASLASLCGLHLEATSIARWQSSRDGALGDLLKAMFKSFGAARDNAPSLLFIDEIDCIGDRNKFPARHADYSTQVVNALLECLDGIEGREGVIVVGACNRPDRIDPAILRGGRLEAHIYFPLPDAAGRAQILAHYLPTLAQDPALQEIAARLPEKSGADLELLSREARRIGRRERRPVSIDDVRSKILPLPVLSKSHQFRVGIHEGGHVFVAEQLDVGTVLRVEIFDNVSTYATETAAHGTTLIEFPPTPFDTRSGKIRLIAMHLAGAVAEDLYFGDRSTMSSGSENSDFKKATHVAVEMVAKYGLGSSTYYLPGSVDMNDPPGLWEDQRLATEVQAILQLGYAQAHDVLVDLKEHLSILANELVDRKLLQGNELKKLLPRAHASAYLHQGNPVPVQA